MGRTRCVLIILSLIICKFTHNSDCAIYHNEFAVHIPSGSGAASRIASTYGFENQGQIGDLDGIYLFLQQRIRKRSLSPSPHHSDQLATDPEVLWVEQQVEKHRVKRDGFRNEEIPVEDHVLNREKRQFFPSPFAQNFGRFFFNPSFNVKPIRSHSSRFPDPLYSHQWYLSEGAQGNFDMNVTGAWAQGYTGKGVVISILDDGIQHNHPDLAQNYDPLASVDINDNDPDPMPRDNGDNKHGTRCAGEVASVAFNDYCGVGIAYNASIGGVRMLDGTVNDAVEAKAISLNPDHVDIYSASWGPEDDGKTVDGPGPLAKRAFINGVIRGRHGKGSIFVWASGNGGRHTDNCNCDGYTNSIFTLSISSASQRGLKPWYLEECSSTLATTYSSGTPGLDSSVVTADMDGNLRRDHICTLEHTGTSASAPLAAGLCALALEANPDLTWRDMQHIVVRTSRYEPLQFERGWFVNAVGRSISHKFGYGLMDAGSMVALAKRWRSVPPQHVCQTVISRTDQTISTNSGSTIVAQITTDGCAGTSGEVRYLEHVQAKVSLRFLPRGNINLKIISPSGTSSTLLFERPRDVLSEKFDDWPFLSVHFWGEKAAGTWKLQVTNSGTKESAHPGILNEWQLILHGTKENPEFWRFSESNIRPLTPSFSHFGDLVFSSSVPHRVSQPLGGFSNRSKANFTPTFHSDIRQKDQLSTSSSDLCHSECIGGCVGSGPQNCRSCRHFSLQGECVRNCPEDTFASDNKECLPCHGACARCLGPRRNQCTACPSTSLFVEHMGICGESCPMGFYADKGSCLSCGNQCADCATSDTCLRCDHNLLVVNGTCRVSCPLGHYEDDQYKCNKCDSSCETCVGGDSDDCASCLSHSYMSEGKCLLTCPRGTYSDNRMRSCRPCPMGCSSCNKDRLCLSCESGWRLKSNVCVAFLPCKSNEYQKKDKCLTCHRSCLNCLGPTNSDCLLCKSPSVLHEGQCVRSCPESHYAFKGKCLGCPQGCTECSSFEKCRKCHHKFFLFDGQCLASCPEGYYSDRGQCLKCDPNCALCWGPRSDQCLSCFHSGDVLFHASCRNACPDGYFKSNDSCRPCFHNCKTCSGLGIHSCTSCRGYLTLDGGMCLECSAGRYYNPSLRTCSVCHNSCLTCNGKYVTNCTSCQAPYSLHPQTSTCRSCCENLDSDQDKFNCCQCHPETGKCLGGGTADRRRIAMSLLAQRDESDANTIFSSTVGVVLLVCLVNVVVFALIMVFSQAKYKIRRQGGLWNYSYERLPVQASSVNVTSGAAGSYALGHPVVASKFTLSDTESDIEDIEV